MEEVSRTYHLKLVSLIICCLFLVVQSFAQTPVSQFDVYELRFDGSEYQVTDNPVRDVELVSTWQHEGGTTLNVYGFFDGDGKGDAKGNIFKVRFCPTLPGKWTLVNTRSTDPELAGQHVGHEIICSQSKHRGFWLVDAATQNRWFKRSDGSHPYILGNTMYSFLSETFQGKPTGGTITQDVERNSAFFNKIRFGITGNTYPHPEDRPFIDDEGKPSNNGMYAHRPNPGWFQKRVDLAVQKANEHDLIADIIMNGPDTEESRNMLEARGNNGDYTPYLRYIAARYGSYPNVWLCISNEFDIKKPRYGADKIALIGSTLKKFLPYPTPVSVHGDQGNWKEGLNIIPNWNDHIIIQNKIKHLFTAADYNLLNYWIGNKKPVINDELGYEGAGDNFNEGDLIEGQLGAFLGAGYGSVGHKPGSKRGHYFHGNFDPTEHLAADNLQWMRKVIDENITFWKMQPAWYTQATYKKGISGTRSSMFFEMDRESRVMAWPGQEYVYGSNKAKTGILAFLPKGKWHVVQYDMIKKTAKVLDESAQGEYKFAVPDSRAALTHFKLVSQQ